MGLFDCPNCLTKKYYIFATLFYFFTIPTFVCVTGLYVKSRVALSGQVSRQLAERGNQLKKAFGVIAFVYTVCMLPYVIATPVMQYFDIQHNIANNKYDEKIGKFSQHLYSKTMWIVSSVIAPVLLFPANCFHRNCKEYIELYHKIY